MLFSEDDFTSCFCFFSPDFQSSIPRTSVRGRARHVCNGSRPISSGTCIPSCIIIDKLYIDIQLVQYIHLITSDRYLYTRLYDYRQFVFYFIDCIKYMLLWNHHCSWGLMLKDFVGYM